PSEDAAASPWGAVDRRSRVVTCGRTPTTPDPGAELVPRCGVRAGPVPSSAPRHDVGGWGRLGRVGWAAATTPGLPQPGVPSSCAGAEFVPGPVRTRRQGTKSADGEGRV